MKKAIVRGIDIFKEIGLLMDECKQLDDSINELEEHYDDDSLSINILKRELSKKEQELSRMKMKRYAPYIEKLEDFDNE